MKQKIIDAFYKEFSFVKDKFKLIELLANNTPIDYETIESLKFQSEGYHIIEHPGVYTFCGNNELFRVGVSMRNSHERVMKHLYEGTRKDGFCVWDIDDYDDKSILLINVKDKSDIHWLLALEAFLELNFQPKIRAGRIG